jgi:signal transduction histidine kinase
MPEQLLEAQMKSAPPDRPAYRPYPELAKAIRSQSERILDEWRGRTLFAMPDLGELTIKEFKNDIARILAAMADALESNDPPELRRLVQTAPAHGFHRFILDYDLVELFAEERILRRVIVARVEEALVRSCARDEAAALHAMIDIMLQQGVLALVQRQKEELRQVNEVKLKYLSFLSHDLSNNFFVITSSLQCLEQELAALPQMRESVELLGAALSTIRRTRDGMRRLLEHEQLRRSGAKAAPTQVRLCEVVAPVVTMAAGDANAKGLHIEAQIDPEATVNTDPDLLTIVLQNLVGNAVKHTFRESAPGATVRVEAERRDDREQESWNISVCDEGPGIPAEQIDRLFNAFERLPQPGETGISGESGFGLGLAIAWQAARLLGTTIEVKTEPGHGSRFSIVVPAPRAISVNPPART